MNNIKNTLNKLLTKEILTKQEAKDVLTSIGKGEVNEYQISALTTIYQMRPITGQELAGFRDAMIDLAMAVDLSEFDKIDIVGTGGDGKNTFNISTLSAIVVAGAGYKVAKHGNTGKSSVSGSSNVLQALGYEWTNDNDKLKRELDENNFCYMHAPLFHPAMKHVGSIRRGLGFGTFFNMLGPLINPSKPKRQVSGVWAPFIMPLYRDVFTDMGSEYAVVHSEDGYDEISLTGAFDIITNNGRETIFPKDIGMNIISPEEIYGGDTKEKAVKVFKDILKGKGTKAQADVIVANSGYAIQRFHTSVSIEDCMSQARESLESGNALKVLKYFNK